MENSKNFSNKSERVRSEWYEPTSGPTRYGNGSAGSAREHQINLYTYSSDLRFFCTHSGRARLARRTGFSSPSILFLSSFGSFVGFFYRNLFVYRISVGCWTRCSFSLSRPFNIPNKHLWVEIDIKMTHIACLTDDFIENKISFVFFDWINMNLISKGDRARW